MDKKNKESMRDLLKQLLTKRPQKSNTAGKDWQGIRVLSNYEKLPKFVLYKGQMA